MIAHPALLSNLFILIKFLHQYTDQHSDTSHEKSPFEISRVVGIAYQSARSNSHTTRAVPAHAPESNPAVLPPGREAPVTQGCDSVHRAVMEAQHLHGRRLVEIPQDGGLIEVSANGVDYFSVNGMADGPFPTVGYLDVAELAIMTYLVAKAHGVAFTAVPVFLVRGFHHGAIHRSTASDSGSSM